MSTWESLKKYAAGRTIDLSAPDPSDAVVPTVSGRKIAYPTHLAVPIKPKNYTTKDPYAHLGEIGYKTNSWRSKKGKLQIYHNLYLRFSRKASATKEEARRLILAESIGGLPKNIDEDSLVSKKEYYFEDGEGPDRTQNMEIHRRKNPNTMFK